MVSGGKTERNVNGRSRFFCARLSHYRNCRDRKSE